MHNEIQLRIGAVNKACFVMSKMFSSNLLSKATKDTLYTWYLRTVVIYVFETWSTTQGGEEKLLTFEKTVLWIFHGPEQNEYGEYEKYC